MDLRTMSEQEFTKTLLREGKFILDRPGNNIDDLSTKYAQMQYGFMFQKAIRNNPSTTNVEAVRALLVPRTNQFEQIPFTDEDVWVFGYGSLVWKADFPFIDRRPGFIIGYQRRFYQNSIDHRGTPSKPGRVVTLIPSDNWDDRVYGMAYRIPSKHKAEVQRHLDHREKNGYERCVFHFFEFPESTGISFNVNMYVATAENASYAGNIPELSQIAIQILTSTGPSGPNREYLFYLAEAMRVLFPGVEDKHLYELEAQVLHRVKYVEPIVYEQALLEKLTKIAKSGFQMMIQQYDIDFCAAECARKAIELKVLSQNPIFKETMLELQYNKLGNGLDEWYSAKNIHWCPGAKST